MKHVAVFSLGEWYVVPSTRLDGSEPGPYPSASFYGPRAQSRAEEYAQWLNERDGEDRRLHEVHHDGRS